LRDFSVAVFPAKISKPEQDLLLADFLPYAETVEIEQVPDDLIQIRDQADQKFLILAVVGRAEALITGDAGISEIKADFDALAVMRLSERYRKILKWSVLT
jgi:predicted nucleic acid-binding protein